ncbi:MAG: CCA tRNA nucleotidyltransferase [Lentisphaerae bacterium]|nr:CCA tRNA nucleotidyltransferase [Lentisphaerota bacterium]
MSADLPSNPLQAGAREVALRLQRAGWTAYWAGGCVRDVIMGRTPKDYDIATNATPDDVLRLFPKSLAVGKAFGVVRVPIEGNWYEVATFRQDHAYRDGRHPEAVTFTDAQTDAARRDFTINALFFDPIAKVIHDFVDGRKDIDRKIIRTVGRPRDRFMEDQLRLLRAVRFSATLGFALEPATAGAIRDLADRIQSISAERIQQELTRMLLEAPRAGDAVQTLQELGLIKHILPEVEALKGQEQPPQFHPEGDVFTHTLIMLNAMVERSVQLAYAVLLHDIGKPPSAKQVGDRIRFDNHARHGAAMAEAVLRRLRFSNADTDAICFCIANHMRFMDVKKMRRATLCRLVGAPTFPVELELHRLDCLASHGGMDNYDFLVAFQKERAGEPVLPEPWVTGQDILALGIPEGRDVGLWKKKVYEAQLDGQLENREAALAWLKKQLLDAGSLHE